MQANVYVDGFNLYHRSLKGTRYKWLDLGKLCDFLLPEYTVQRIRYFTARVHPRGGDGQQPLRQQTYIRALETIAGASVHYGMFRTRRKRLPLAHPAPGLPRTAEVLVTEEKGSDVNLATHLLADGFQHNYDVAVVISNDSDLSLPIQVVRGVLARPVGVVITDRRTVKSALPADFYRRIRERQLRDCQFPASLTDRHGTIRKPAGW